MKNSEAQVPGPHEITEPEKLQAVNPTEVLLELIALLEDSAPTWYTKNTATELSRRYESWGLISTSNN